jgi:hypothetical protein
MFMLASGAGLGYRAIRRGARSGFGSTGDCHQSVLKCLPELEELARPNGRPR